MTPLETQIKLIIKEAIFEALEEYTTKIGGPQDASPGATVEPGTRKRKNKNEVSTDNTITAQVTDGVVTSVTHNATPERTVDPAAEYKVIQQLVVDLLAFPAGRDRVVAALKSFGVDQAQKIQVGQYPQLTAILRQQLAEESSSVSLA